MDTVPLLPNISESQQANEESALTKPAATAPPIAELTDQTVMATTADVSPADTPIVGPTSTPPSQNGTTEAMSDQMRRSSARSIKRKRFDDEIVEFSNWSPTLRGEQKVGRQGTNSPNNNLSGQSPPLVQPAVPTNNASGKRSDFKSERESTAASKGFNADSNIVCDNAFKPSVPISQSNARPLMSYTSERRRGPRSNKRMKRKVERVPIQEVTKDLGRWKPVDDLALIIGIQQTNDLRIVHRGVKFSCKFTLQELQARWFGLLYEPAISRIAVAAMRNLHPELVASVKRKALFSAQEEELLATIKSTDNPKLKQFHELIEKNPSTFYEAHTAKMLQNHWQMMKQYQLLADQVIKPETINQPLSFSDAEELILDSELLGQRDEALQMELERSDRQKKRKIRLLENELNGWNAVMGSSGPGASHEFDNQTLAVLRGHLVRYLMRSKEITFGRVVDDYHVDVDLSLEGPASKISRQHGTIKLRSNGDFFIANEGKRPIFINGVTLLTGHKTRLANNYVLEICGLRFIFLVNHELIKAIQYESAKTKKLLN